MEKEYLYVGHYIDTKGNYILKVGTTNNLKKRQRQHNTKYKTAANCPMAQDSSFEYDWHIELSKYNTLRFEDRTRAKWKEEQIGKFITKDRFLCEEKPTVVQVVIRKTYEIYLWEGLTNTHSHVIIRV